MITELLRRRTKLGVPQSEICRRSKVHAVVYGKLEKGKKSPLSKGQWSIHAQRLASFYRCDPEDLFRPWMREIPTDPRVVLRMVESQNPYQVDYSYFELQRQVHHVLKTLTPREEKVLRMRFGIGESAYCTLEEIGQDFEVTKTRIREIEAKAFRKLRHPTRSKRLKAFVSGGLGPFQTFQFNEPATKVYCHRCGEPFYTVSGDGKYCQGDDCWSDHDEQKVHYKRDGDTFLGKYCERVEISDVSTLNQKRRQRWKWYQRCQKLQAKLKNHPNTYLEIWYPPTLPTNVFDVDRVLEKEQQEKQKRIREEERKEREAEVARRKAFAEYQAQQKALREAEEQEYRRKYPELVAAQEREIKERAKRMKLFIHRNGRYCQPFSIIVNGERILETSVSAEWLSAVRDGDIKILYKGVPMGEVEAPEESQHWPMSKKA